MSCSIRDGRGGYPKKPYILSSLAISMRHLPTYFSLPKTIFEIIPFCFFFSISSFRIRSIFKIKIEMLKICLIFTQPIHTSCLLGTSSAQQCSIFQEFRFYFAFCISLLKLYECTAQIWPRTLIRHQTDKTESYVLELATRECKQHIPCKLTEKREAGKPSRDIVSKLAKASKIWRLFGLVAGKLDCFHPSCPELLFNKPCFCSKIVSWEWLYHKRKTTEGT